jgi:hypothetical protein
MLHRLVERFVKSARSCFGSKLRILGAFLHLADPTISCTSIIREIVGAGQDTKVLVAVDEVAGALEPGTSYATQLGLRALSGGMDRGDGRSRRFICLRRCMFVEA